MISFTNLSQFHIEQTYKATVLTRITPINAVKNGRSTKTNQPLISPVGGMIK